MSSGTSDVSGLVFGGTAPGGAATEEWSAPAPFATNDTLTAS
jgi:hypothetical protein